MNILSQQLSRQNIQVPNQTITASTNINTQNKKIKTSIFYINDIHGQIPKMQRLVSASKTAELGAKAKGSDILKVCSGDTFIGSDEKRNLAAASFLDIAGIDAQALGNHEFDITASICSDLLKNSKVKTLGMNLNFPNSNSSLSKNVLRSTVIDGDSGQKYGLIGVQPSDLAVRLKNKSVLEGITTDDKDQTLKELQQEVDFLKAKGLNKIILLSHEGNDFEREIAQKIDGIDVIIGGHSHHLIEGVKQGENLLYSPSGEPVIITQAGRDGNYFGTLNLEFNEKGQITLVQNNVQDTNTHTPNLIMSKTVDSILGESPVVGTLKYADKSPKNSLTEENAWADFVCDALITNLDADISFVNSGNFRGTVDTGTVTERDIASIFPFNNKLFKVKINEKDLVEAIKFSAKSLSNKNSKPGLLQVGGLSYTVNSKGELKSLLFIDKQGQKRSINIENPSENTYYTAVYDEFLLNGGDDMEMLERDDDEIIERYPFDKDKVTVDYIKSLAQPFEVRKDNRIQIIP